MSVICKVFVSIALWMIGCMIVKAQPFKLMRYDESYGYLKDSARNFYTTLKYLPIAKRANVYVSFGGEVRYEYAGKIDENWIADQGYNYSFLQRYSLHTNIQLGSRLRVFGQLNSALENGSKYGAAPVDEDKLSVQNLFVEVAPWIKNKSNIRLRVGRQEMDYGSGRLISVREGTNVRVYFTGAKAMYFSPLFRVDAFVMESDDVRPGVFDNVPTHQANLWGTYLTWIIPHGGNLDFSYLGIRRDNAQFDEGIEKEVRHTFATRYWKYGGGFIYNLEAAYQFGKFGRGNIRAWAAAVDIGYMFENAKAKPSINLRGDYISGDRTAGDGSLQTFNPIYPKGGYFGFNPLIGPANLIDLHPYAIFTFSKKISLQLESVLNWRTSLQDGVYRPNGTFYFSGIGYSNRYIGTTYLASTEIVFNKYTYLRIGVQYFDTGGLLDKVFMPSANSTFFNSQLTFKF